jgi:hypothetical protein
MKLEQSTDPREIMDRVFRAESSEQKLIEYVLAGHSIENVPVTWGFDRAGTLRAAQRTLEAYREAGREAKQTDLRPWLAEKIRQQRRRIKALSVSA